MCYNAILERTALLPSHFNIYTTKGAFNTCTFWGITVQKRFLSSYLNIVHHIIQITYILHVSPLSAPPRHFGERKPRHTLHIAGESEANLPRSNVRYHTPSPIPLP